PKYTYALLLRCAILGSSEGRLTQREIFASVKAKFPHFRTANATTWQGSMRHQLSLNRLFELEDRPVSLPGQGGYWRVNLSA
ncbi:winged helix DNA-binding domain-containing protein, partial [Peniophora sp. CONT]